MELSDLVLTKHHDQTPVILSIPHGGEFLFSRYLPRFSLGDALLIDTDLYTRKLYDNFQGTVITTNIAPHQINMSRPSEVPTDTSLPPHMAGADCFHNTSLTGREILREPYRMEERQFLLQFYEQYHFHLRDAIERMRAEQGYAFMIDCHSLNSVAMKNTPDEGREREDLVVGTLEGKSAGSQILTNLHERLEDLCERYDFSLSYNDPYKGGFITQTYANPDENVHVIQLELKKQRYMDESLDGGDFNIHRHTIPQIKQFLSDLSYNLAYAVQRSVKTDDATSQVSGNYSE